MRPTATHPGPDRTFPIKESRPLRTRVFHTHRMECLTQHLRTTKEHPDIRLRMLLLQTRKHPIPIRPPEVRGGSQRRDGVPLGTDIRDVDVRHIVIRKLRGEINGNLDSILRVLFFDRVQ
jgi:hypothetical protein